jgi:hypothetical protein
LDVRHIGVGRFVAFGNRGKFGRHDWLRLGSTFFNLEKKN